MESCHMLLLTQETALLVKCLMARIASHAQRGQYQDEKYQTECKSCGSKMTTPKSGAKSKEECKSTDACVNGKDNCATTANGGTCTSVGNGTVFTCGCRAAYELQPDKSCRHKCDNPEFCLNGGTCSWDNVENPTCVCTDKYEGERCDIRSDATNDHGNLNFNPRRTTIR
ncbi:hypothetical protein NP493_4646g00003 [Ridgeia piscesae]|uniref:EGF-like domain-containing protein n=1 Tax=Ridgeia piscesae TaxID=27915 RepID=A0AAD9IYK9_RIDPI|nr:hypothetical protein NP493_4646g00003 [Ridgeia piscesae]